MACGCPVVTSDTSAMPETAGGAAVLADPKDPEYMMADKRIHGKAAEWHLERGKTLQQQQHLTDALVEFQKTML